MSEIMKETTVTRAETASNSAQPSTTTEATSSQSTEYILYFILGTVEDFGRAVQVLGVKIIFKNQDYEKVKVFGSELPGVQLVIVPDFQRTESTSALIEKVLMTNEK